MNPPLQVFIFLIGLAVVILTLFSAVSTFVLPRAAASNLNRIVFGLLRRIFELLMRFSRDYSGRDAIMAWQTDHRVNSPYPLRHNGSNTHVVARRGDDADFSSYIHVTQITAAGVTNLSSAIVNGTVRRVGDALCIADLEVVLDTRESVLFSQR